MTDHDPLRALCDALNALRAAAGGPTYRMIVEHAGRAGEQISHSGVGNLLGGATTPRQSTVTAFVAGCWSYARGKRQPLTDEQLDRDYWARLIEAARATSSAGPELGAADTFDDRYHPAPAWDRIAELVSALPAALTPDQLVRLLWDAMDDIGPLTVATTYELLPLLRTLDTMYVPAGCMPPALALLEYVAVTQPAPVRRGLQRLIDELTADSRVTPDEAAGVRERAGRGRRELSPVSVFLKVEPSDGGRYGLTAWLYRPGSVITFKREAPERYDATQLRGAVEGLISEVGPLVRGVELGRLTFEFVLPWNLLGEVVEWWRLDDGRPIGSRSPVVVRSLERMRDPWAAGEWRRRSELLHRPDLGQAGEFVVTGSIRHGRHGLRRDSAAYLAADGPYVAPASWRDDHPLLAALKDGLPVAVWQRDGGDPQWLVELVHGTVTDAGLDRLPTEVLRLRSDGPPQDGSAVSVCLLWDDYHRQPESVSSLTLPSIEGEDR
ncbi:hypothetical protein [Dactylosporangium sp. NPDC000521]|uniref:VMAP-C domain-containing protein n=1 Tax=Dactylosporangium sp. NPDC000521 TaxID=3363975 RepID=UPI0036CA1979